MIFHIFSTVGIGNKCKGEMKKGDLRLRIDCPNPNNPEYETTYYYCASCTSTYLNAKKRYDIMRNQLTNIEVEKGNISKKIDELTQSLSNTNIVETPFVKNSYLKKLFKNSFIFHAVDINYIFLILLKCLPPSNLVFKKVEISLRAEPLLVNLDPKHIILALLCCLDNLADFKL